MIFEQGNKKRFLFQLFTFLSLVFFQSTKAQDPADYQKIYNKTYLEIAQKDFDRAVKIADSLYTISETPQFKARSLMLSASLFKQSGEIKRAVEYALKAETVLQPTDEAVWKAKVFGFLSTQYRDLWLVDQSKIYIDKSLAAIAQINDPKMTNQLMGFVMQERAYYEMAVKNYEKSILSVKEAQRYFDLTGQNNAFLSANNHQLLGLNYFHLKKQEQALLHYEKALQELGDMPDNFLKGLVFNGMARVFIEQKDKDKAREFLKNAEKIGAESKYLSLKKEILKTAQLFHLLTADLAQLENNKIQHDSISEKINEQSLGFINDSYQNLNKKNQEIKAKGVYKNYVIAIILFLMAIGISYFFIYRQKKENQIKKIRKILADLKLQTEEDQQEEIGESAGKFLEEKIVHDYSSTDQQTLMTAETEQRILKKLKQFEQTILFTKSTASLPFLSSYCETNTKYLSYVINTHRGKDFKNYINHLRVMFVIDKLKNDPQYRKYKISTLSEEAGFSTQSKFASAFKKVTEVSPSAFLKHMETLD